MASSSFQIKGLRELGEALKALGDDVGSAIGRSAVAQGAGVVKKAWKASAPVAKEAYKVDGVVIEPGNIGRNVITKRLPKSASNLTTEYIVTVRHKGSGVKGQPYRAAIFKEFGTVKQAAEPWARPAYEQSKTPAVDKIVSTLKKRIDKANKTK